MRLGTMFSLTISKSTLLVFLFSFLPNITAQPVLVNTSCSETAGNFAAGSAYQTNLATVLTDMADRASTSSFYNTSSGTNPDSVFGLYYCRALFESECQLCIRTAALKLQEACPTVKQATAYYLGCTLRYADHSIFSVVEETPFAETHNPATVSDPAEFRPVLNATMDTAIEMAAFDPDPRLLGVGAGVASLSSGANLTCLAQCSRDVTGAPCSKCLRTAFNVVPGCCDGSLATWIFFPSCDVMYLVTLPNDNSNTASQLPWRLSPSRTPSPLPSETITPPPSVTSQINASPSPSVEHATPNPSLPGKSGGWTLNCGVAVRFGLLAALIMIFLEAAN